MLLTLTPIGIISTPFRERIEAPRQGAAAPDAEGRIELAAGMGFEDALDDLAGFHRIWVIYWFHGNTGWKPKVLPPRSDDKRGVFATRSPHRPNPIGMTAVELVGVEGLEVRVRGVDMLDGTPVLDLKPYVAYADAFPDAAGGWLAEDSAPRWEVAWSDLGRAQRTWLDAHGVALGTAVEEILAVSPRPHAYRRIRREGDGYRLAWKDFRVSFTLEGTRVTIVRVQTGYRTSELTSEQAAMHRAFVAAFP